MTAPAGPLTTNATFSPNAGQRSLQRTGLDCRRRSRSVSTSISAHSPTTGTLTMRTTEQVLKDQERQAAADRQKGATTVTNLLDEAFDVDNEEGSKFDLV